LIQRFRKEKNVMKLQGKQLILPISSLVLCCSAGWTQSFYTNIQGTAATCSRKDYSEAGRGDISDQTSDPCSLGTASASSSASLDSHQIAMASAQNAGGATALAKAFQTATLIPPKGFTSKSVVFSIKNSWALKLEGVGPGTGMAKVCVEFLGNQLCQLTETNGVTGGVMHGTFKLTKSSKGFQLPIANLAYAEAAGNAPPPITEPEVSAAAIIQSNPTLVLPRGWKCKYDSGTSCP
jgi:hypothetical protein